MSTKGDYKATMETPVAPSPPTTERIRRDILRYAKHVVPLIVVVVLFVVFFLLYESATSTTKGKLPNDTRNVSISVLSEVTSLRVVLLTPSSVSVAWNRPPAVFDSYKVTFSTSGTTLGSCVNGTTLDPTVTQVTCENLESCTLFNLTVYTQRSSTSSEVSAGVTLNNIQVPGKDPGPPIEITYNPVTPRKTELQWSPPQVAGESQGPYEVTVCPNPDSCPSSLQDGCHEGKTRATNLVLSTMPVTNYCIVIHSTSSCFGKVYKSQASAKRFGTPAFAPGEFKVTAKATSPTSIELIIDPPKEKNGNLDGCTARCSSSENQHNLNCTPDDLVIAVDGLTPSSEYTCRVTFYNNHEGQRLETTQEVGVFMPNGADQQSSYLWLVFLILFCCYLR